MANKRIDLTYDADSQYATITRYAGLDTSALVATATYTFDAAYELVGLTYTKGTTMLAGYAYGYDDAGRMTQMKSYVDAAGSKTADPATWAVVNYHYDAAGQLATSGSTHAATYTNWQNAPANEDFNYDDNGNRDTGGNTVESTGDNRQHTDSAGYTYTYDDEGNVLSKTATDGSEIDYAWDYRDRLTSVTFQNSSHNVTKTVTYVYDAFNRWIGETISVPGQSDVQTRYVYENGQIVAQFDKTGSGNLAATDLSHRYLWNPQAVDQFFADEVHFFRRAGATTCPRPARSIGRSPTSRTASATWRPTVSGTTTLANHLVFDSFGKVASGTAGSLFGYTGRPFDSATGEQNNESLV